MIIIRPSFNDYVNQIEEDVDSDDIYEAIMAEMPMPATRFKNPETGEFDEKAHHISSTLPVFMGWDDIMYLYQFPPEFWTQANCYRYNKALYEAKTEGEKYNELQNITFTKPGRHSQQVTFLQRNTFAKKLLDKIERQVDIDHFRKSNKSPENVKKYEDDFEQHGKAGRDMGGYTGADMSDARRVKDDLWVSKGFMGPDPASVKTMTSKWIDASSHGLLGDPREHSDTHRNITLQGGRNATKEVRVLNSAKLDEIAGKMESMGAVPFQMRPDGKVFWKNVRITGKTGNSSEGIYPDKAVGFPHLPVLLPGKAVDSKSSKQYLLQKHIQNNVKNIDAKDLMDIEKSKKAFEDARIALDEGKYKGRTEKAKLVLKLKSLQPILAFDKWLKEKNIKPTEENIKDLKVEFSQDIHNKFLDLSKSAESHDAYSWNVHNFNRNRKGHDPLGVGMDNPLHLGGFEHKRLRNKTHMFGGFFPNRQSKSMVHAPEGEWEDKFQKTFGVGDNNNMVQTHLNSKEFNHIEANSFEYMKKVAKKVSEDPEVMEFLDMDSESIAESLLKMSKIRAILRTKGLLSPNGSITGEMPEILSKGYKELNLVEKKIAKLQDEVESGYSKSDIAVGVDKYINSPKLGGFPDLKAALQANRAWIILNAENVVRRNMGESPFRQVSDNANDPNIDSIRKHKHALDAKEFVMWLGSDYAERIGQLKFFGENGAAIESRRLRQMAKKVSSIDVSMGDSGASAASTVSNKDQRRRINQRVQEPESSDKEIQAFVDGFFGSMKKSRFRKNRAESDSDTQTIGHNIDTVYKLAANAAAVSKQSVEISAAGLSKANGTEVTSQEKEMLQGITNSLTLYNFFVGLYSAKKMGPPEAASKWAKEKMMKVLKRHGLADESDEEGYKSLATAIRYSPSDQIERQAGLIMRRWEEEETSAEGINAKIDDLIAKLPSAPNQDSQKSIIDRLCVLNDRKPQFGTINMAAYQSSGHIPNVQLNKRATNRVQRLVDKYGKVSGFTPEQPPKPVAPVAPNPAIPQGVPATMPPVDVHSNPLLNRLRKPKPPEQLGQQ